MTCRVPTASQGSVAT